MLHIRIPVGFFPFFVIDDRNNTGTNLKGICNRLALVECYLLDMDLALYALWLLSEVKFDKSSIYYIIMKLDFTKYQRKDEKGLGEDEARTCDLLITRYRLSEHSYRGLL